MSANMLTSNGSKKRKQTVINDIQREELAEKLKPAPNVMSWIKSNNASEYALMLLSYDRCRFI